jgi:hypothetical protein
MSAGAVRVTIECSDGFGLINWAKRFLEGEGYVIDKPAIELHAKETPTQFCTRLGLHPNSFRRTLRHADCPSDYEVREGAKGSIMWIRASSALEEFVRENLARVGRGRK